MNWTGGRESSALKHAGPRRRPEDGNLGNPLCTGTDAKCSQDDDVTTEYSSGEGEYYTDNEIAGLLGISVGRLRNKLSAG